MVEVGVIGAGPAGAVAALRAAELGARTTLVTKAEFGGTAANDGPVPVRALAQAARLLREARQMKNFGISVDQPKLNYLDLLAEIRETVDRVKARSSFRRQIDELGVVVHENAGAARFADRHTIETASGLRIRADRFIICAGGASRKLPIPGFELTSTHSDAWSLTSAPESMIVIGSGATGAQVASIFNAFGSRVELFEAGPRIIPTEDPDVSEAVAQGFRAAGIVVRENFGKIVSFEKTASGVRMNFTSADGVPESVEAQLAVVAVGWVADTAGLGLDAAGVELNNRGFIKVDEHLRTTQPHIFAGGDITGRLMLVSQALQDGYVAATNALLETSQPPPSEACPVGSFTDPEYAHVGIGEAEAKASFDALIFVFPFNALTRSIIDRRTFGFCKIIVDRKSKLLLGCHVVGDRAVDIAQVAAIVISARMAIDDLATLPLSFPTYAGVLSRAAASACQQMGLDLGQFGHHQERTRSAPGL